MDKEEILKYARIFSTAKGDTHKIHFVNENKTINEPDLWKEVLNLIDKLQKENQELKENNENLKECVISWQSAFKLIENQNIKLINEYLKK